MSKIRNEVRNNREERQRKKKKPLFSAWVMLKYVILTVLFAAVSYGLESIVLWACNQSPTGKCGNGMITLYEIHNSGAAFGILQNQPELITMASFIAIGAILAVIIFRSGRLNASASSALAVLSAGIIMNLYERINMGYVIDYISLDFWPQIPMFNASDIMIVFGAFGIIYSLFERD